MQKSRYEIREEAANRQERKLKVCVCAFLSHRSPLSRSCSSSILHLFLSLLIGRFTIYYISSMASVSADMLTLLLPQNQLRCVRLIVNPRC